MQQHVESTLFPFLLSINSPLFDIQNCNFSKKNMKKNEVDKNKSKDTTGRVAIYNRYGVIRCYTIEASYNMCNRVNKVVYPEQAVPRETLEKYLKSKSQDDSR